MMSALIRERERNRRFRRYFIVIEDPSDAQRKFAREHGIELVDLEGVKAFLVGNVF